MNYELLAILMGSVIGGLGYLVKYVHCREMEIARVHRGLRKYMTRDTAPEMSS